MPHNLLRPRFVRSGSRNRGEPLFAVSDYFEFDVDSRRKRLTIATPIPAEILVHVTLSVTDLTLRLPSIGNPMSFDPSTPDSVLIDAFGDNSTKKGPPEGEP